MLTLAETQLNIFKHRAWQNGYEIHVTTAAEVEGDTDVFNWKKRNSPIGLDESSVCFECELDAWKDCCVSNQLLKKGTVACDSGLEVEEGAIYKYPDPYNKQMIQIVVCMDQGTDFPLVAFITKNSNVTDWTTFDSIQNKELNQIVPGTTPSIDPHTESIADPIPANLNSFLKKLTETNGHVSIFGGMANFEDGCSVDLSKLGHQELDKTPVVQCRIRISASHRGTSESTYEGVTEQACMEKALQAWAEASSATLTNMRIIDGRLCASAHANNGFLFQNGRDYMDVSAQVEPGSVLVKNIDVEKSALTVLKELMAVLNQDSDGGWFICEEAKDIINSAEAILKLESNQHQQMVDGGRIEP